MGSKAGASEGERGGVAGQASKRGPVTDPYWAHHHIAVSIAEQCDMGSKAGASEGERGGVAGQASKRGTVTDPYWAH